MKSIKELSRLHVKSECFTCTLMDENGDLVGSGLPCAKLGSCPGLTLSDVMREHIISDFWQYVRKQQAKETGIIL